MENNCWEFNTNKEKVMLVERGKHFAKLARAASAPSAADVCPAGITKDTRRWTRTQSCLAPGGAERVRCGVVLYPRQVKQTRHSRAPGARAEEAEVPFGSLQAPRCSWLRKRGERGCDGRRCGGEGSPEQMGCPHHLWSHTQMVETSSCWRGTCGPKQGRLSLVYQRWHQHNQSHVCLETYSK